MKRYFISFILALMTVSYVSAQSSEALQVKVFTLDNGLTVWINEDPNQTAVYGAVVVKAGAVDCPGTGIAHYFEHMMFKGTDKIGTIDYEAEKPYLDSISAMYDKLAETEDDSVRHEIQMDINRLSIKAADYAIPTEFNTLIAEMGGSGLNAFTSYDETVYHNQFLPEYFEQWAELNSERIMNPVFRLFQSELETVYEEKNMGDDQLASDFRNKMLRSIYKGTGYTEEIVGTTENLKNPRLAQMREFFEKYYVASNMGLILTGNIKADEAMPTIEKCFGRIRKGEPIERSKQIPEKIQGANEATAQINMPIVRLGAVCFSGPSKTDEDFLAVSFLTSLLNNDAGTGLLDKLMVDHKLMLAQAMPDLSFRDAGSILVLYMPKLLFQREKKATQLIFNTFQTLKSGDFSDEYFESCKLSYKKALIAQTENLQSRMQDMAFAFSDGLDWNEILKRPDQVDAFTKEDIVAIANKYLGDDYVLIHKKKGTASSNKLQKPDYEKVTPKNREASSAYAQALRESASNIVVRPKLIDIQNDAAIVQVAPMTKLYAVSNPYNDVFSLTLNFCIGTYEKPDIERMVGYVNLLGTESKSFDEIHSELQAMGSSISYSANGNAFCVNIDGFDKNFDKTLAIAADLLKNIKGERKKLNNLKSEEKASIIMNRSDMDALDDALYQKVLYGDRSEYLTKKGAFTDDVLLGLFHEIQNVECDIIYSGTLDAEQIASEIRNHIDVNAITVPSKIQTYLVPVSYDSPQVFFVNKKKSAQSQIRMLMVSKPAETQYDRYALGLYGSYLGGGMSSLLFQEIREFRSMAYSTSSRIFMPNYADRKDVACSLGGYVGTQTDKTADAMTILDSLITQTPFLENKIEIARKERLNKSCNDYPDFRSMPYTIRSYNRAGYAADPAGTLMEVLDDCSADWMRGIWQEYVAGRNYVWCIVGNMDKTDMTGLEKFGPVTILKSKDIIK